MNALIFCDIDGCLSDGKNRAFDLPRLLEARAVIARLAKHGIGFTLCTGRPQPFAEAVAQTLDSVLPLVCEGGALVYAPATDTYLPVADSESLRAIAEVERAIRAGDILTEDLYFEVGNAYSLCLTGPAISDQSQRAIHARMDDLKARFGAHPVAWSHSTTSVDITPQGISKGSGVEAVCARLGVPLDNTAGIGDSNGDLGLFAAAAHGYCPSNASPELQAQAVYVSPDPVLAGTLDILNRIADNPSVLLGNAPN
ncbi:MAG: HAD family hydrolase [Pseudomonadota bacterium]